MENEQTKGMLSTAFCCWWRAGIVPLSGFHGNAVLRVCVNSGADGRAYESDGNGTWRKSNSAGPLHLMKSLFLVDAKINDAITWYKTTLFSKTPQRKQKMMRLQDESP